MTSPTDDIDRIVRAFTRFSRRTRGEGREVQPGLTYVDFSLLRIVANEPGILAGVVAGEAYIDKSTASRQLTSLVERGLVRRADGSGRRMPLYLTDEGLAVLEIAEKAQRETVAGRTEDWSDTERATFAELLDRYNAAP
ncbi:MarR family winged helix-turn-helix transcriptional regulator [Gordonia jinhuaensis]|uniref:MarR family winged helix-turn-helix transcriptional regulator n=1 Tax=Gordonia jinhuaensis TaxID=1517702 RepID=UPI001669C9B3|nr:MarR family winged helix-turn-helix transcriptional regulator [Gordonia jinhuaensis]